MFIIRLLIIVLLIFFLKSCFSLDRISNIYQTEKSYLLKNSRDFSNTRNFFLLRDKGTRWNQLTKDYEKKLLILDPYTIQ